MVVKLFGTNSSTVIRRVEDKLEDMLLRFSLAATAGDKETVLELLAPDVVAVSDGGGVVRAALIPLEGPDRVEQRGHGAVAVFYRL